MSNIQRASVLLGGLLVNGIVLAIDEDKERTLGDALAKLQPIFKESSECVEEKLFIVNSTTKNCFSFDLAVETRKASPAIWEL